MVEGLIFHENLEPFLTTLSWLVGYSIGDEDWQAITNDLLDGGGGSFEWAGNQPLKFEVALVEDNKALQFVVDVPLELAPQVELAVAIFRHFRLRKVESN